MIKLIKELIAWCIRDLKLLQKDAVKKTTKSEAVA
jgi:hypothetical protein